MRKGMGKFVGVGKEVKKFLSIFFVSVSYVRRKGVGIEKGFKENSKDLE